MTKRYDTRSAPAVDNITLEIPAGEIVMLVGPSGCGKTTTMKMINRLIEPSSGRILIGDDDVTRRDADELRRHIGYVIQGAGLFPTSPSATTSLSSRACSSGTRSGSPGPSTSCSIWSASTPVSTAPAIPRELSGGQQQRVGVARALGADPPVLLMDEPFGAVDPITRHRLQDELLRLQQRAAQDDRLRHARHRRGSQARRPDRLFAAGGRDRAVRRAGAILGARPTTSCPTSSVSGAALKQLTLTRVRDVELHDAAVARIGGNPDEAIRAARSIDREHVIVLDDQDRPQRWMSLDELQDPGSLRAVPRDEQLESVNLASTLNDALDSMLTSSHGVVVVTGRRNAYQGVIRVETIMDAMADIRGAPDSAETAS